MKERTFENGLVVKHRKSAIIFENRDGKKDREERFEYLFSAEGFKEFSDYMTMIADEAWKIVQPKEADSHGADYAEYYDRKYDDNGDLRLLDDGIRIKAPYWSTDTLYQFNKPKIQSFLYDLNQKLAATASRP